MEYANTVGPQAAVQRFDQLYAEQQSIYRTALHRTVGLTCAEQRRLEEIALEMALALDARHRESEPVLE
jgi:hypothetical protein